MRAWTGLALALAHTLAEGEMLSQSNSSTTALAAAAPLGETKELRHGGDLQPAKASHMLQAQNTTPALSFLEMVSSWIPPWVAARTRPKWGRWGDEDLRAGLESSASAPRAQGLAHVDEVSVADPSSAGKRPDGDGLLESFSRIRARTRARRLDALSELNELQFKNSTSEDRLLEGTAVTYSVTFGGDLTPVQAENEESAIKQGLANSIEEPVDGITIKETSAKTPVVVTFEVAVPEGSTASVVESALMAATNTTTARKVMMSEIRQASGSGDTAFDNVIIISHSGMSPDSSDAAEGGKKGGGGMGMTIVISVTLAVLVGGGAFFAFLSHRRKTQQSEVQWEDEEGEWEEGEEEWEE